MVESRATRSTVILLLVPLVIVCGSKLAQAQRRGGKLEGGGPGSSFERIVPLEDDNSPFDIKRERLPRAYGGHNIQIVYDSIQNSMATVAQGHDPERNAQSIPAGSALNADSIYAFQVRPEEIAYDKRQQKVRVSCQVWSILAQGKPDTTKSGFRIAYVPRVDHSYTYAGPDGRNIEIEEKKFREYTVAFENLGAFPLERRSEQTKAASVRSLDDSLRDGTIVAETLATKEQADQLKQNVRLLVLCHLAEPYATWETIDVKGTPEKPGEYLAEHKYLHARLLELWLYDAYSGKVLRKMTPEDGQIRYESPQQ